MSGEHARLSWAGDHWEIRDLGSRNGTFVDGRRLDPGVGHRLRTGAAIGFGEQDAGWELTDDGAPSALAIEVGSGSLRLAEDGLLALPDAEHPDCTVYSDARGVWVCERPDQLPEPLEDGVLVAAGGLSWRIRLPEAIEGTATVDAGMRLDAIGLRFAVSRDEEHVQVFVRYRGKEVALEEREHGYVLLTLARARLREADEPLPEQGWIDRNRLLKMLAVDANALNVSIYRARGQLSAAGVDGAAGVVEVRRGQRRLGIEPDRLTVERL